MGKKVAVSGCVLEFTVTGGAGVVTASGGMATPPSPSCMAEGKGVYRGTLSVAGVLAAAPPFAMSSPAGGVFNLAIIPTESRETADGLPVAVEGDASDAADAASSAWAATNPSSGATLGGTVQVRIKSAGQGSLFAG